MNNDELYKNNNKLRSGFKKSDKYHQIIYNIFRYHTWLPEMAISKKKDYNKMLLFLLWKPQRNRCMANI